MDKIQLVRKLFIESRKYFFASLILGFISGFGYALFSKTMYNSELTFVMNQVGAKSNQVTSLMGNSPLSDIAGLNEISNSDNILTILTSKLIIKKSFFYLIQGTGQTIIDKYIKVSELEQKWTKLGLYPLPKHYNDCSPRQDSALNQLAETLVKKKIITALRPRKKEDYFTITMASTDEQIAAAFVKSLLQEASAFFISFKTSNLQNKIEVYQKQVDSLRSLLNSSVRNTIQTIDNTYNLNPAFQSARSQSKIGEINSNLVTISYNQALQNLELTKLNLLTQTPLFKIVDEPTVPLVAQKVSYIVSIAIGVCVGLLFYVFIFTIRLISYLYGGIGNFIKSFA